MHKEPAPAQEPFDSGQVESVVMVLSLRPCSKPTATPGGASVPTTGIERVGFLEQERGGERDDEGRTQ